MKSTNRHLSFENLTKINIKMCLLNLLLISFMGATHSLAIPVKSTQSSPSNYLNTLLNSSVVPYLEQCPTVEKKPHIKLCRSYEEMVRHLETSQIHALTSQSEVDAALSKYNNESVAYFCTEFPKHIPKDAMSYPETLKLLQFIESNPQNCVLLCNGWDQEKNIVAVEPFCRLIDSGFLHLQQQTATQNASAPQPVQTQSAPPSNPSVGIVNDTEKSVKSKIISSIASSTNQGANQPPVVASNESAKQTTKGKTLDIQLLSDLKGRIVPESKSEPKIVTETESKIRTQPEVQPDLTPDVKSEDSPMQNDENAANDDNAAIDENAANDANKSNKNDDKSLNNQSNKNENTNVKEQPKLDEVTAPKIDIDESMNNGNDANDDNDDPDPMNDQTEPKSSKINVDDKIPNDSDNLDAMNDLNEMDDSDLEPSINFQQSPQAKTKNKEIEEEVGKYYEQADSNFFSYFMFILFVCVIAYVVYHNKSKMLALLLEGRRSSTSGRGGLNRRKHTAAYRKLDSNLEEAITSNASGRTTQVIY